jgi:tyrosinase
MVEAANQLRWPFWDYAAAPPAGLPALPDIITDASVQIEGQNGRQQLNNPLARYDFRDPSVLIYNPINTWMSTYRWPSAGPNPVSDNQRAARAFANVRQNLQDQVFSMFTRCDNYLGFSSDQAGGSSFRCSNNIETTHNTV